MKKILLSVLSMILLTGASYAQNFAIGVSGTALYYDASGTETVKSSSTKNSKSESGVVPVASLFVEAEAGNGVTIGLDVIPYGAKIADFDNARTDTDTDDSADTAGNNKGDINFSNHVTLYIEKEIDAPLEGAFVKVGVSRVSIETDETTATGSTYGDENTTGFVIGVGSKRDLPNGSFMKIEAQYAKYSGATFNGSLDDDSVKNKIELDDFDTASLKISVGRQF